MAHVHHAQDSSHAFADGSWGAQILEGLGLDVLGNGDVVESKHWSSLSFQSTDLISSCGGGRLRIRCRRA